MGRLDIRIYGDEVLRRKAEPVKTITPELVELARDMLQIMYDAPGIGLAAPQVGVPIRLVVIDVAKEDEPAEPRIYFNPEVTPEEGENPIILKEEGCLSVPDIWAEVPRPERVSIKAQNEKGEWIEEHNVGGMLARCVQHEVDHLDGTLFVDRISAQDKARYQKDLRKMVKQQKGL
ncbi:MAG TPA: peptide deformylase [Fibrobacteraceae bacterium]|nr:peptide deformylase [Fibrobacteraceae bacterium]